MTGGESDRLIQPEVRHGVDSSAAINVVVTDTGGSSVITGAEQDGVGATISDHDVVTTVCFRSGRHFETGLPLQLDPVPGWACVITSACGFLNLPTPRIGKEDLSLAVDLFEGGDVAAGVLPGFISHEAGQL